MEWQHEQYSLTDDTSRLDFERVCSLILSTYWGPRRSRQIIEKSVKHSLNFSLFHHGAQVGFARIVTDYSTHAYLADVVLAEEHRGKGVGSWMVQKILDHPALASCRVDLFTRDAQGFYRRLGFGTHKEECLVRYPPTYGKSM